MADDQEKAFKKELMERLDKAKGRLQQALPEIQQLIKTSNVVEVARKIVDPAQSIFKQFADDIQLKDLFVKAEALVANANLTFAKAISKDTPPMQAFPNETHSDDLPKATVKKAPSKRGRPKKPLRKGTPLKKKKRPSKRNVKRPS
jgi:hypothetical protein